MNLPDPKSLAIATLKDPAEVARTLLGLNVPREALWAALGLLAVFNALFYMLNAFLVPSPLYEVIGSPLRYFVLTVATIVLFVLAFHRVGRMFGGKASLNDSLVLVVWHQSLYLLAQVVVLFVSFLSPLLGLLLLLATIIVGVFVLLHFINQAHRLNSIPQAVLVLLGMVVAIIIGLSIVLIVIGTPHPGNMNNV